MCGMNMNRIKVCSVIYSLLFLAVIFFANGCGMMFGNDSGYSDVVEIALDEPNDVPITMALGQNLVVDMVHPGQKGRELTGASFDPAMLKLVHFSLETDDGIPMARYVFEAVGVGIVGVVFKAAAPGGEPETYRSMTVEINK